jgi:glycine/D-amino acid oxidase-like deaminating enzyme
MFIRVSTYVADLERLPADLAISQLRMGLFRGVSYLDGGWVSLVEGLTLAASAAGAKIRTHQPATGISAAPGGWRVALSSGEVLPASAVVIAAGGPSTACPSSEASPVAPLSTAGWTWKQMRDSQVGRGSG